MLDVQLKPAVQQATFRLPGLQRGQFVTFSQAWPSNWGIKPGMTYQIIQQQQVITPREFITPAMGSNNDFIDVDLSNATGGQFLYPTQGDQLHEVYLGFKPFSGFVQLMSPQNITLFQMPYTGEFYTIGDTRKRMIGAIKPFQSPASEPRLRFFFVYLQQPMFARVHVLGTPTTPAAAAFDKAVLVFYVNRLGLRELVAPSDEAVQRSLRISALVEDTFQEAVR